MPLALVCALVANVSYGLGTVLQSAGARRASTAAHLDVMLFARLSRQPSYVAGLGLDAIGFVASLIALRTLPLFAVQAAIAGSIGVTAIAAVFVFGLRLRRSDTIALVVLMTGLGLLAVSAGSERPAHLSRLGEWAMVAGVGVVVLAGAMAARLRGAAGGVGLAICAGLGFTGTAIAARTMHFPAVGWHVVFEPLLFALVGYGTCGMLMFASALQRGSVTATSAVTFAVETIVPSVVGLTALGDHTRPHFQAIAVIGFGFTVGASLVLARYSESVRAVEHEVQPVPRTTLGKGDAS
jgi:drug/metabolite transporter (DMT)-like permease